MKLPFAERFTPALADAGARLKARMALYAFTARSAGALLSRHRPVRVTAEALDHVFERFFRVEGARPDATLSGFGLGLSIAAWIVAAHGGVIEARNRPGGGSEFEVRFASDTSLERT